METELLQLEDPILRGRHLFLIALAQGFEQQRYLAGALDDDIDQRPIDHIFVGSKAPWYEIADDLPQFEQGPQ